MAWNWEGLRHQGHSTSPVLLHFHPFIAMMGPKPDPWREHSDRLSYSPLVS